jgi:hypothetical protein
MTTMATAKVLFLTLISLVALQQTLVHASFASNMKCTWGYDNCQIKDDTVKLILNQWSGILNISNEYFLLFYFINYEVYLKVSVFSFLFFFWGQFSITMMSRINTDLLHN